MSKPNRDGYENVYGAYLDGIIRDEPNESDYGLKSGAAEAIRAKVESDRNGPEMPPVSDDPPW